MVSGVLVKQADWNKDIIYLVTKEILTQLSIPSRFSPSNLDISSASTMTGCKEMENSL